MDRTHQLHPGTSLFLNDKPIALAVTGVSAFVPAGVFLVATAILCHYGAISRLSAAFMGMAGFAVFGLSSAVALSFASILQLIPAPTCPPRNVWHWCQLPPTGSALSRKEECISERPYEQGASQSRGILTCPNVMSKACSELSSGYKFSQVAVPVALLMFPWAMMLIAGILYQHWLNMSPVEFLEYVSQSSWRVGAFQAFIIYCVYAGAAMVSSWRPRGFFPAWIGRRARDCSDVLRLAICPVALSATFISGSLLIEIMSFRPLWFGPLVMAVMGVGVCIPLCVLLALCCMPSATKGYNCEYWLEAAGRFVHPSVSQTEIQDTLEWLRNESDKTGLRAMTASVILHSFWLSLRYYLVGEAGVGKAQG